MKRFQKIVNLSYGSKKSKRVGFASELRKLISFKQRLPLQYIH